MSQVAANVTNRRLREAFTNTFRAAIALLAAGETSITSIHPVFRVKCVMSFCADVSCAQSALKLGNGSPHEFVKQGYGKSHLAMRGAKNHPFIDQASAHRAQGIDLYP